MNRRHFIVTEVLDSYLRPTLVKARWIAPDGIDHPICEFEAVSRGLAVVDSTEPALCEARAAGEVHALSWAPVSLPHSVLVNDAGKALGDARSTLVSTEILKADVDNDGQSESLVKITSSDSAGCGEASGRFLIVTADHQKQVTGALSAALADLFVPPDAEVVRFKERTFVSASTNTRNPEPALLSLNSASPKTVCTFAPRTQYRSKPPTSTR